MAQSDEHGEHKARQQLQVDTTALRGLAHPLRGRILDQLQHRGPATATILGERLGESSGSTSYHLRQLARYGFIETVPGKNGGRGRWWRIHPDGRAVREHAFRENPKNRDRDRRAAEHALSHTVPPSRHRRNRAGNGGGPLGPDTGPFNPDEAV